MFWEFRIWLNISKSKSVGNASLFDTLVSSHCARARDRDRKSRDPHLAQYSEKRVTLTTIMTVRLSGDRLVSCLSQHGSGDREGE